MQRYCFLRRYENLFWIFSNFLCEKCCGIGNYDFCEVGFRLMSFYIYTYFKLA